MMKPHETPPLGSPGSGSEEGAGTISHMGETASNEDETNNAATRSPTLSHLIWRIAGVMKSSLGTGDMAELRRLHAHDPGNPAFWKVAAHYLEPGGYLHGDGPKRDEAEQSWAAILNFMAHLTSFLKPGIRLGTALAGAGLSELRFVRLLRAQDDALLDEVRTLARFLSSKGQAVDPTDIAWLLLSDGRSDGESVRRRVARDYYSRSAS